MRKGLVAANWKMNGQKAVNSALLEALKAGLVGDIGIEVLVCPPSVYLSQVSELLTGSRIFLGAQNVHPAESGAFTGEISSPMLRDLGCSHVIVGHSERREFFGESDGFVAEKFAAALAAELVPVLCVGETRKQRETGETEKVVLRQLDAVIDHCGVDAFKQAVIAYEPVWAIGTGLTATPDQAQEVHALLRSHLADIDQVTAAGIRILYGGSVKGANANELFAQQDIDGALVGGASLDAEEFLTICRSFR